MDESGKAIALHDRRVHIAYEPEGSPFVNDRLQNLWSSHQAKLDLVYEFLVEERYWFGSEPSDPEANQAALGAIKRWTRRNDKVKQRGFYVDIDKVGDVLDPDRVADRASLADVIDNIHQIGWQLRLGEHIEATGQKAMAEAKARRSKTDREELRQMFPDFALDDCDLDVAEHGDSDTALHNDAYRLHLPPGRSNPFQNLGMPGYEAQTRELARLAEDLDEERSK